MKAWIMPWWFCYLGIAGAMLEILFHPLQRGDFLSTMRKAASIIALILLVFYAIDWNLWWGSGAIA